MRTEIKTLDSPDHSLLIFTLDKNKMYASELARQVKEQQGTIQRRLKKLKEEGYVLLEGHPKKKKNIKLFSVNWDKINEEFIKYLQKREKQLLQEYKSILSSKEKKSFQENVFGNFEEIKKLEDKKFVSELEKNEFLTVIFQEIFTEINTPTNHNFTSKWSLNSVFGYLFKEFASTFFISLISEGGLEELKNKDKNISNLLTLERIISDLSDSPLFLKIFNKVEKVILKKLWAIRDA